MIRVGALAAGLLVGGCVSVDTEFVSSAGQAYVVATTKPTLDYVAVSVGQLGVDEANARRARTRFERVARPQFRSACASIGKRPSAAGLSPSELADFDADDDNVSWTFGRQCV